MKKELKVWEKVGEPTVLAGKYGSKLIKISKIQKPEKKRNMSFIQKKTGPQYCPLPATAKWLAFYNINKGAIKLLANFPAEPANLITSPRLMLCEEN